MVFTLKSIYSIGRSDTCINKFYYSLRSIAATTFLLMPFSFLYSLLSTNNEYILDFNPTNSLFTTPVVSFFILPITNLLECRGILTKLNNF